MLGCRFLINTVTRKSTNSIQFLIHTDSFIDFIPQMDHFRVAKKSIFIFQDVLNFSTPYSNIDRVHFKLQSLRKNIQVLTCRNSSGVLSIQQKEQVKVILQAPVRYLIWFSSSQTPNLETLQYWKSSGIQTAVCIFPNKQEDIFQRRLFEMLWKPSSISSLDLYYFDNEYLRKFIYSRLHRSLDVQEFHFFGHFSHVIFDLI